MNYSEILADCKDEVARLNGFENWEDTEFQISQDDESRILHEAALLAMQRVGEATYEIDFAGNVLAKIKISETGLAVEGAINGYGDAIDIEKIIITKQS